MPIKNVTIIGGGTMGGGIAQTAASFGFNVTLVEVNEALATKSKETIAKNLERAARRKFKDDTVQQAQFVQDAINRLATTTNLKESFKTADLVIEAIIEKLSAKQELFSIIDKEAPQHTIFVSNTSSLSINEIAAATKRLDRFGGLHFFSPVPLMRLVEIIRTAQTTDVVYNEIKEFATAIGKTSITCKDTPGFVVNSLLIPYSRNAMRLLEEGIASARDIDIAMKLGAGYPMGPIELADNIGLDVCLSISQGWYEKDPENPLLKPSPLLVQKVKEGKLGVKTGEGFYKYN